MGIVLDFETADRITLACLKEHLGFLETELAKHRDGAWMHPDDVVKTEKELIPALNSLIEYFGG
jgi:hypothetical protein